MSMHSAYFVQTSISIPFQLLQVIYHQLSQTACIKPCQHRISQNDFINRTERSHRVLEQDHTDKFLIIYFLCVVLRFEVSKTDIIVINHVRSIMISIWYLVYLSSTIWSIYSFEANTYIANLSFSFLTRNYFVKLDIK